MGHACWCHYHVGICSATACVQILLSTARLFSCSSEYLDQWWSFWYTLRSNNVLNALTNLLSNRIFLVLVRGQRAASWAVFSETQVRQHGLWCQVQEANTNNTTDNNIGDWYYPTPSGLLALDNINNDSTPYQELKCDNQVGLVVDGDIINSQGVCITLLSLV